MMGFGKVRGEESENRIQLFVGIIAVLLVVSLLAVAGFIYFNPFGERAYRVKQYVTGGLKPSDNVRLAGIDVGLVKSVVLEGDHVLVSFTVKDSIKVGDESSTEVRLLTPVGGHFLNLSLKGKEALGDKPIPIERSHSPFDEFDGNAPQNPLDERKPWELLDVLGTVTNNLQEINAGNLHKVIDQLTKALDSQPDAIRSTLEGLMKLVDIVAARQEQLRQAVGVAHEYLKEFGMEKDELRASLNKLARLSKSLSSMQDSFPDLLDQFTWLIQFLQRPLFALENRITTPIGDIEDLLENLMRHPSNPIDIINQIIESVMRGVGVLYDHEPRRVGPENRNACIRAGRDDC